MANQQPTMNGILNENGRNPKEDNAPVVPESVIEVKHVVYMFIALLVVTLYFNGL